jgi:hypothetical protein
MQAKTSRCATCVVALAAGLVAGFAGAQTVESPVKVTDGPWGKSVSEPQISQLDNNFPAYSTSPNTWKYILVWQVQDTLPGAGSSRRPTAWTSPWARTCSPAPAPA